jgi:hypothetical protein
MDFPFSSGLSSVGIFLGAFGVVHLVLAWGLFEREPWARMLGVVIGFLALLRFPLGTALGIYTLWVLLPEESGREYDRLAQGDGRMNSHACFVLAVEEKTGEVPTGQDFPSKQRTQTAR